MCDRICGTTIEEVQALSELKDIPPTEALAELRGRISMDDDVANIHSWKGTYFVSPDRPYHTTVYFNRLMKFKDLGEVSSLCSCMTDGGLE